jgi:hypothetical protein
MKKAELKRLKKLIERLPDIPIIEDGGAKYTQVIRIGLNVKPPEKGNFVNKVKFFLEFMKKGKTGDEAVTAWNEKYKRVQEQIVNLAEERKNNPPTKKDIEKIKQEVADANQKLINKYGYH